MVEFNQGDLRSVNIVQAQERTRLVLNLRRSVNHAVTVNGTVVPEIGVASVAPTVTGN